MGRESALNGSIRVLTMSIIAGRMNLLATYDLAPQYRDSILLQIVRRQY